MTLKSICAQLAVLLPVAAMLFAGAIYIARPHAEEFVRLTVSQTIEDFRTTQQQILDEHVGLTDKMADVEFALKQQHQAQAPIVANQKIIIDLLKTRR